MRKSGKSTEEVAIRFVGSNIGIIRFLFQKIICASISVTLIGLELFVACLLTDVVVMDNPVFYKDEDVVIGPTGLMYCFRQWVPVSKQRIVSYTIDYKKSFPGPEGGLGGAFYDGYLVIRYKRPGLGRFFIKEARVLIGIPFLGDDSGLRDDQKARSKADLEKAKKIKDAMNQMLMP